MTTVPTVAEPPVFRGFKEASERRILRDLGASLVAHWNDPEADPRTLAERAKQVGVLVLAELEGRKG